MGLQFTCARFLLVKPLCKHRNTSTQGSSDDRQGRPGRAGNFRAKRSKQTAACDHVGALRRVGGEHGGLVLILRIV